MTARIAAVGVALFASALVERVAYDSAGGNISITFHPSGIQALGSDFAKRKDDAA